LPGELAAKEAAALSLQGLTERGFTFKQAFDTLAAQF
jgi:hypothetical protein